MCRRVRRGWVPPLVVLLGCAALAGCGPVRYVGEVGRAATAIDEARAVQAERYAPYWWTRATEYLHKAREVAAHADYQGAGRFGRIAADAATRAAADARIAARDPSKRPLGLPPDVAPTAPTAPIAPIAPIRPTEAPVAPTRDLPAPARAPLAPAKDRPAAPRSPPGVAPAKDPR